MKHRIRAGRVAQLALLLGGIALTGSTVACGSSAPPEEAAPVTDFSGVYEIENSDGDSADDIAVVGFVNGQDYALMTNGCYDAGCVEHGTFYFDEVAKTITFANAVNGAERVVPIDELETAPIDQAAQQGAVKPQDTTIVNGNGTVVVGGNNNNVIVNQGGPGAPMVGPGGTSELVKRCPAGTKDPSRAPTDTTPGTPAPTQPKTPSGPPEIITTSLQPLATPAGDPCHMVKPTRIAKSAKIKTKNGAQRLLNRAPGIPADTGPGFGGPGFGGPGFGSPGGGLPFNGNSNGSFPTFPSSSSFNNNFSDRLDFCNNLAANSRAGRTPRAKQQILMECLTDAASRI